MVRSDMCRLCRDGQRTLNSSQADTARGGVNQNIIALLHIGSDYQSAVAGGSGDKQAGCLGERPALGHRQHRHLLGNTLGGICSLRSAKNPSSLGKPGVLGPLGRGDDDASELGARNPWESCLGKQMVRLAQSWPTGDTYVAGSDTCQQSGERRRNWSQRREPRSNTRHLWARGPQVQTP